MSHKTGRVSCTQVVAALVLLIACLWATAAQAREAAATPYGPCCPLVKGAPPSGPVPSAYWPEGVSSRRGPHGVCKRVPSLALAYEGATYSVSAVETADTVLVPQRIFALTGATVDWLGGRRSTISLAGRTLHLTLGSREVAIEQDGSTTQVTWPLCPRLLGGTAYVPLRAAAGALGLTVAWQPGLVTLAHGEPVPAADAPECPASRLEAALGVTVLRGSVEGPFGPGVGILAVTEGGRGAALGLKPKDVIIRCGDKPISCPVDLDAIVAQGQAANQCVCQLTVVRDGAKVTLQSPPAATE